MAQTPASIRYGNPGAQWPGQSSKKFGASDYATIGGGNQIAIFSDPVNGAAAQFDLLSRNYSGIPLSDAIRKWSGGNASDAYIANIAKRTGLSPDTVLSPEFYADPSRSISLAKAMAAHEAGQDYPLSDDQWSRAFQLAQGGNGPVGLLSSQPPTQTVSNSAPSASPRVGLLAMPDATGGVEIPPAASPGPQSPSPMGVLRAADRDAAATMPAMDDFQFSPVQRAPIDLSKLAAIAQSRQRLGIS